MRAGGAYSRYVSVQRELCGPYLTDNISSQARAERGNTRYSQFEDGYEWVRKEGTEVSG